MSYIYTELPSGRMQWENVDLIPQYTYSICQRHQSFFLLCSYNINAHSYNGFNAHDITSSRDSYALLQLAAV